MTAMNSAEQLVEHAPGLWVATARLCEPLLETPPSVDPAKRRTQHFRAGRVLARRLLQPLGGVTVVGRSPEGAPIWPEGLVGSIAHSDGHAVVAAARRARWIAIGVDVEPDAPLPADAASLALTEQDRAALHETFGDAAAAHDRVVFGAKECVHKALNPLNGAWLEFDEVAMTFPASRRWRAAPLSRAARLGFEGRVLEGEWWRRDGALWTLLALPANR